MSVYPSQQVVSLDVLLADLVPQDVLQQCAGISVSSLAQDNRQVRDGCLFIASQGFNTHGLLYAVDAVANGAIAVVWDGDCDRRDEILDQISNKIVCIRCDGLKELVGEIAARFYQHPSHDMNVIGITGTDGKTSIAHFIAQSLDGYEVHCGVMGTLGNGFINDLHPTGLTTADALQVQTSLHEMRVAGAKNVVMEVSSHGLDQGRVNAVEFDTAVFSNLAQDHLDYHQTREVYAQAKRKLFFMPGLKVAVINLDDEYGRELAKECRSHLTVWGYGVAQDANDASEYADFIVSADSVEANENGLRLKVTTPKGRASFSVGLFGRFNVSNILAAFAALLVSGVEFEAVVSQLENVKPVSGRMQKLTYPGKPVVVIDYAHTPQALEASCRSIREHFSGQFIAVFGCGGDRDKSKRPMMAAAAEKYADSLVVTSDNPRHEEPQQIADEIVAGFSDSAQVVVELDRKQAIDDAINRAGADDVVLIAGKGHESSQIVGDVHIAFNDYRVAQKILEAMA